MTLRFILLRKSLPGLGGCPGTMSGSKSRSCRSSGMGPGLKATGQKSAGQSRWHRAGAQVPICAGDFCVLWDQDRDRSLRDERERDQISLDCPAWLSRWTIGNGTKKNRECPGPSLRKTKF